MKQYRFILFWGYVVELLLVLVVYGIILNYVDRQDLPRIVQDNWGIFCGVSGGLLAIGVTFLIFILQMANSEFGKYLAWRKADVHYWRAYQVQVFLFFLATVMPIIAGLGKSAWAGHAAWIFLLYATVNVLTVIRNTVGLVRLQQTFLAKHDAERAR